MSLIVDITNYVMLETGQPSTRSMPIGCPAISSHGGRARANNSKLDHVVRDLDPEDLVIADDSGPLALAGTMGGVTSEIDDRSRNILLEAAHFDPVVVARMSRRHKLSSEGLKALRTWRRPRRCALRIWLGRIADHPAGRRAQHGSHGRRGST